ncbi:MAG TPA: hypothetical protein VMB52_03105 [Verrucomicrobiae bacterium]|nr:hypothetical protein [Verrucomicrobiae bacterium]
MPPVLPEDTPVAWTDTEIMEAAASGVEEFTRRARLNLNRTDQLPEDLKTALRIADIAIEETAKALNATPVKYEWFLYPGSNPDYSDFNDSGSHPLIPPGYSLVARVKNIPTTELSPAQQAQLAGQITHTTRRNNPHIADLNVEHVVADRNGQLHLVDIDAEVAGVYEGYL